MTIKNQPNLLTYCHILCFSIAIFRLVSFSLCFKTRHKLFLHIKTLGLRLSLGFKGTGQIQVLVLNLLELSEQSTYHQVQANNQTLSQVNTL